MIGDDSDGGLGGGRGGLPTASAVRSRWPGLVWAIPLAALIVVTFLGVRALTRRGIDVVVTFGYAEGVTPGDTKVLVAGVEAGHVSKVRVSEDRHHVDVTLSLDPRERGSLNSNTKFWLIGENPTITDIQSIRAAVAGVIIGMAPGSGGTPTRHFEGLDSPPLIAPGTAGRQFFLDAPRLGSIQPGAAIVYHGLAIGKVVSSRLTSLDSFQLTVFVQAPYDGFVRRDARFWTGSPLKLSLSGGSLSAGLSTPSSVLQGSVEFDLPADARNQPPAPAGSTFRLFDSETQARQGPPGPAVLYRLAIDGTVGDLPIGSDVTMLGYAVGTVRSARLAFGEGGRPYTEAVIALYPDRLGQPTAGDARAAGDAAIGRLLRQGYRAHVAQSPPFVGAHVVSLARDAQARPAALLGGGAYPTIPMADGGSDLVARLGALPLEQIGENVRRLTGNLAALTGSPQVRDGIVHLDGTLRQLDQILTEAKPQIAPTIARLNEAATQLSGTAAAARTMVSGEGAAQGRSLPDAIQQLDAAARSIRGLTDYLGRHPEALIRGKAKEKSR